MPRAARTVAPLGAVLGRAVPRRPVLRPGAGGRCPAAGRPDRGRRHNLDVPASFRQGPGGCELDRHPGHPPRAPQDPPEARGMEAGDAHPPGGVRGRRGAHRRHRAPAPGAARGPASAGPVSAPRDSCTTTSPRACLVQSADSIPRVVLLGRLCLFGRRAERLHEVLVPVAARWVEPSRRAGPLKAYAEEAEARTLERLESALQTARAPGARIHDRLLEAAAQDVEDLLPQLEERAELVRPERDGTAARAR